MNDTVIVSKNKDVILKHQRDNLKTSSDQGLDEDQTYGYKLKYLEGNLAI